MVVRDIVTRLSGPKPRPEIEPGHRQGEEETVNSIQRATVRSDDSAEVSDAEITFDDRLGQVAHLAADRDEDPEGHAMRQRQARPGTDGDRNQHRRDRARQRALIARDPFGIKPLYMTRHGKTVAFASEMRPLYRLRAPRVDETALAELLTFAWAAGRLSNIKDIERLPGGTAITVNLTNGDIAERRYCDPLDTLTHTQGPEPNSAQIEDALRRSVHDHLMSHVGFTLQLSGGLDSSLIAALTRQTTQRPLTAYGVDLGDYRHNEAPQRAVVAGHCHLA